MDPIHEHSQWTAIGSTSNQLILYNPSSHALSVQPHGQSTQAVAVAGPSRPSPPLLLPYREDTPTPTATIGGICPACSQPLPAPTPNKAAHPPRPPPGGMRTRGYFQILEDAHEGSMPPSPAPSGRGPRRTPTPAGNVQDILDEMDLPGTGYYERYFREEGKLGMGAEGSVFLATHVIEGNVLGTYAVKKIAVGRSKSYLVKMLREVRILEALRHPNIITYHHSWVDTTRFSSFGPPITALHVLMMFATAGNLDSYLLTRAHSPNPTAKDLTADELADAESLGQLPRAERIKAFKKRRQSSSAGNGAWRKREENRGVLMLGVEEIGKLFGDVVEGLSFLHANSILHLDLKCSNVLLDWEEGKLMHVSFATMTQLMNRPRALLSDFGTSEEMLKGRRERTGHTGTMEYMAPETLVTDTLGQWRPSDSHADMWSLGLILHKLLYLRLPYPDTEDYTALLQEIVQYKGFTPTPELYAACENRHIPRDLLLLLSRLVHVNPEHRPTADKVKATLKNLEVQARAASHATGTRGLVSRVQNIGKGMAAYVNPKAAVQGGDAEVSPWRTMPPGVRSPVRPILALPSPQDEKVPIVNQHGQTVGQERAIWSAVSGTQIRFASAGLKILSLQAMKQDKSRWWLPLLLVVLSLADIKMDRWELSLVTTGLHLALMTIVFS